MSPSEGPCTDSQLRLWKSTHSVGNINTSKLAENKLLADEKVPWKRLADSYYLYKHVYFISVNKFKNHGHVKKECTDF